MTSSRESLWAVAPEDRPRERLVRLGPGGLTDPELVALVLGSGMPGVNVLDSARSLLSQAGGVTELMTMTVGELKSLAGVGLATAGRVVAVAELWRRANDPPPGSVIERPEHLVAAARAHLAFRAASPSHPPSDPPGDTSPAGLGGLGDSTPLLDRCTPVTLVVIADAELRLRVVVPLAAEPPGEAGYRPGSASRSTIAAVLHEVLYRGGSAFGIAEVMPANSPASEMPSAGITSQLGATSRAGRDVLRLAASTVGLRYLSTVQVSADSWSLRE